MEMSEEVKVVIRMSKHEVSDLLNEIETSQVLTRLDTVKLSQLQSLYDSLCEYDYSRRHDR